MQPDGWSAQVIEIVSRFSISADLDPATGKPVGDEGYYLYILNEAANWDYSVDLALAQIAALGATMAVVAGMDPHGGASYWISLGFTFLGAGLFAVARTRRGHIPQEAFIGIAYAVASAGAILAMSKATGETEHLKDMLVGNIIAVSWHKVQKTAVLYALIGLFHYVFRKKFLMISVNPAGAEAQGLSIRLWDFLFYASFGFVVTSSVAIAGVLLVFCYLVVPSVGAMLFTDSIGSK